MWATRIRTRSSSSQREGLRVLWLLVFFMQMQIDGDMYKMHCPTLDIIDAE